MSKNTIIIFGCLGLVILFVCALVAVGLLVLSMGYSSARQEGPTEIPALSESNETPSLSDPSDISAPLVREGQLPAADTEKIFIPEVELLAEITTKLRGSSWKNKDSKLPISTRDLDQSLLAKAIEHELSKETRLKIPAEFEYLFLGSQAESEIKALLAKSYDEYLSYLQQQNVKPDYIKEFRDKVLPNNSSRIFYIASNNPSPASYVEKYSGSQDYGELEAKFYARHLYNEFNTVSKSGIFGTDLTDQKIARSYRDLGVRFIAYHEFTHVLQRAHANLNLPAGESMSKSYVDALLGNGKSLMNADDSRWRLNWGPSYLDNVHNQVVSEERQSDSIGFAVLSASYKFDAQTSARLKQRMFGRLDKARDITNSSLPILHQQNPNQDLGSFGSLLVKEMQIDYPAGSKERKALSDMLFRLDGLPAYVGYFNLMNQQELDKLWQQLGK